MVKVPGIPWSLEDAGDTPVDAVLTGVVAIVSGVAIRRLAVKNPNDNDDVWYIERDSDGFEVQIDAHAGGQPPFSIASDRRGQ
jgi:hypothetical protein